MLGMRRGDFMAAKEILRGTGDLEFVIFLKTVRLLNEEKQNDDRLRGQFKEKWTRMASEQLTTPLQQECGKYRGILHAASNADQTVKQKFEESREGIRLLSITEPELR